MLSSTYPAEKSNKAVIKIEQTICVRKANSNHLGTNRDGVNIYEKCLCENMINTFLYTPYAYRNIDSKLCFLFSPALLKAAA